MFRFRFRFRIGGEPGVEEFGDSPGGGQAASPKESGQRGISSAFAFFLQLFAFFFLFGSFVEVGAVECDLHLVGVMQALSAFRISWACVG